MASRGAGSSGRGRGGREGGGEAESRGEVGANPEGPPGWEGQELWGEGSGVETEGGGKEGSERGGA